MRRHGQSCFARFSSIYICTYQLFTIISNSNNQRNNVAIDYRTKRGARSRLTDLNGRNSIFGSSLWPGACSDLLPLGPCTPIPPPFLYPHPFTPLASVTSLAPLFTPPTPHPTSLSMAGISFGHIGISDRMRWGGIDGIGEVEGWFIEGKTEANVIDLRIRGKLVRKLIQLRSMIPKDGRIEGRKRTNILSKNNVRAMNFQAKRRRKEQKNKNGKFDHTK
ncbi:hypothetical protein V1477_020984 [Vespula maculifrons]|uniref:Uncharacterized protein n=1 Tax=Vespula maculifrons TaxID=7453 RepID=A0ABD2ANH5_VESMC